MLVGLAMLGTAITAAPSMAAQDQAAPVVQKKTAKYIGNSETKKYHIASCKMVTQMKPENKVELSTKADAKKAGYEPCKVCLPPEEKRAQVSKK